MAFDIASVGNLTTFITSFTFRNSGQIQIPKERREIAYEQTIDIIVASVAYPQYFNGKVKPPSSFFGYVTLVYQDCFVREVPLNFPRQRVYYERQWQAFQSWQAEKVFWENYQFHRKNDLSLAAIMGGLEIPYEELIAEFKEFNFVELPLREVYVNLLSPSQFKIEYRQVQPVPYTDPFGNERRGQSNQEDNDKDKGIPVDGLKPKVNDPSNPFEGNDPVSSPSLFGGFRLDDDKLNQVADNSADIPATPTTDGYYVEIKYSSCSSFFFNEDPNFVGTFTFRKPAYSDSFIRVNTSVLASNQPCDRTDIRIITYDIFSPTQGISASGSDPVYGSIDGVIKFGKLPLNADFNGRPYP